MKKSAHSAPVSTVNTQRAITNHSLLRIETPNVPPCINCGRLQAELHREKIASQTANENAAYWRANSLELDRQLSTLRKSQRDTRANDIAIAQTGAAPAAKPIHRRPPTGGDDRVSALPLRDERPLPERPRDTRTTTPDHRHVRKQRYRV